VNTLPDVLVDFRSELERAIAQDTARRRPIVLRSAAVFVVAGALGAAALASGVFTANGPSIVERASAALAVQGQTILHVTVVGHQENGGGTTSTWRDESWQSTMPPYERLQVEQIGTGPVTETSSAGDAESLYDAKTNTVYVREEPAAPVVGGKVLRWKNADGKVHRIIVSGGRPAPPKTQDDPIAEPFRREVLELLRSGDAKEAGRVTLDGREAIRIVGNGGRATYFVDADTYDPIEFRTEGDGGGTSLRFVTYETLPLNEANAGVLSVQRRHRDAKVVNDPAAFREAQGRLFPKG
jgi:hypothetical protein